MKPDAIEEFLTRVKQLSRTGSKDMRLSLQEANALAANLAELLYALNKRAENNPPAALTGTIDGGTFNSRKS